MIRTIITLVILAAVAGIAMFAADRPGSVTINWQDTRINMPFIALVLGFLVCLALFWFLARAWSWIKGGTPLSPERRALRKSQKGVSEVDAALSALAAGDARKALALGQAAIKHLDGAGIAYVVAAQAATATGKDALAEEYFDALSKTEQGKFLGLRGRVSEARRLGRVSKALELSEEALEAAPRSDWAIATAFELEAKLGKWEKAEATLRKATAKSIFDGDTSARHLGAIRYGQALAAQDAARPGDAARHAKQALAARPDFVPAAVLAAQLYKSTGKIKPASKIIEKVWKRSPHPQLAEAYAALIPTETAEGRLKRFKALAKLNPDHRESRLRVAEAALGAGLYDEAEESLEPCLQGQASARAGALMSQVAIAKGADKPALAQWADIAARGGPEPAYECTVCRTQRALWTSHCPTCDSFNSFEWDQAASMGTRADIGADPLRLVGGASIMIAGPGDNAANEDQASAETHSEEKSGDVLPPDPPLKAADKKPIEAEDVTVEETKTEPTAEAAKTGEESAASKKAPA